MSVGDEERVADDQRRERRADYQRWPMVTAA
jgi:hypothetical protein